MCRVVTEAGSVGTAAGRAGTRWAVPSGRGARAPRALAACARSSSSLGEEAPCSLVKPGFRFDDS